MSQNELSLKVLEAYVRDVGRGVAKIDMGAMDTIGASTGDAVEIKGRRRTVSKCLPLDPSDEGKGIVRMDGLERHNSDIEIGDTVTIKKIRAVAAEKVIVASLESMPPIDGGYLAGALEGVMLIKGDNVTATYFGGKLTFEVVSVTPESDAGLVTSKTEFTMDESSQAAGTQPKIGIIMGSSSDANVMADAARMLDTLGIAHEDQIISAHRTPDRLATYAKHAKDSKFAVIIAGAGGAAHLPGMIASHTTIPVIGVPIMAYNNKNQAGQNAPKLSAFGGLDSLLSITEMPAGAPVVSVGVNKAKNAGLYAAMILATNDDAIAMSLEALRASQRDLVLQESQTLQNKGLAEFDSTQ